jgi:hypothetical protein
MLRQKVESFFNALLDRDFNKASAIAGGRYKDTKWEETRYDNLTEIVYIHEPYIQFQPRSVSGVEVILTDRSYQRFSIEREKHIFIQYEVRSASGRVIKGKIIMRQENPGRRWFFEGGI